MAKRRYNRKYTPEQMAEYYRRRQNSSSVSENQQIYARHWLDGYTDIRGAENIRSARSDVQSMFKSKRRQPRWRIAIYVGYKNGLEQNPRNK